MTVTELYQTIRTRQQIPTAGSYTASLFEAGIERIAQKVGEEAVEVVIASLTGEKERIVSEFADLLYHSLVLMAEKSVSPEDILIELDRRKK